MFKSILTCDICGTPMKEDNTFPPTIRYFELRYKTVSPLALPFHRNSSKFDVCNKCMTRILECIRSDTDGDNN